MKKFMKYLAFALALTIYLNIGFEFGTFLHTKVISSNPANMDTFETICAGGWNSLSNANATNNPSLWISQVIMSVIWPVYLAIIAMTWIAYGLVSLLIFLFSLVFAGGLAALIGTINLVVVASWIGLGMFNILIMRRADRIIEENGKVKKFWLRHDDNGDLYIMGYIACVITSPAAILFTLAAMSDMCKYKKQ